jgi:hypothetical protein
MKPTYYSFLHNIDTALRNALSRPRIARKALQDARYDAMAMRRPDLAHDANEILAAMNR